MKDEKKLVSIDVDDIKDVRVLHPRCPGCGETLGLHKVAFGGQPWHESPAVECGSCGKVFDMETGLPMSTN